MYTAAVIVCISFLLYYIKDFSLSLSLSLSLSPSPYITLLIGDEGDNFYVVDSGEVEVSTSVGQIMIRYEYFMGVDIC